jgi:transcriptional regulator with XRE-family HTH domain
MKTNTDSSNNIHHGRNVKRFRELLGWKQEALAYELGEEWNQKRISLLEAKETIEDNIIEQVAKILKVPVDAIKNFTDEAVFNIIGNTVNNHDQAAFFNYYPTFNPIDKVIELFEENKKLYEQLLQSEREKIEILKGKN